MSSEEDRRCDRCVGCRAAWCASARTSRIGICHNASPVSTISLTTRRGNSQHQHATANTRPTKMQINQSYNINECTQHPDSTSHRLHLYGVKHAVRSALPFDSEERRTLQSRSKRFHPAHPSRHRSSPRGAPKTREGERERDLPRGVSLPSHPRTYLTAAEPSRARRAIRRTFGERRGWRPAWPRTSPLPPSRPAPPPIRPPPLAPRWPCIAYR